MSHWWRVGDVRVTAIVERQLPAPLHLLLAGPVAGVAGRQPWLCPAYLDDRGRGRLAIQSLLVETPSQRVLVDTCIGDRRDGVPLPPFDSPFLSRLAAAGCGVDDIDLVVCTHLHFDHVGWNARQAGGRWQVTFPRARYLICRDEWERSRDLPAGLRPAIDPLTQAGVLDLVDGDHQLGDYVRLVPAPGHTPGHVSVRVGTQEEAAFVTGDLLHHPLQVAEPWIGSPQDADPVLAERTRRSFLADRAADGALVIGTHFAGPAAGRVVPDGDSYQFVTSPN